MSTVTVDISKALPISGWMTETELSWLAEQALCHSRIVEIGSHLGRSTMALADHTLGWVLAFDDWRGPRDVHLMSDEVGNLLATARLEWNPANVYAAFQRNFSSHIESGKVRTLRGDHGDCSIIPLEFLRGTDEEKPDMVFIDGSHEFADVKRDLLIWQARLAQGGLLCGHDIDRPDIVAALLDVFQSRSAQVPKTNIWMVKQ